MQYGITNPGSRELAEEVSNTIVTIDYLIICFYRSSSLQLPLILYQRKARKNPNHVPYIDVCSLGLSHQKLISIYSAIFLSPRLLVFKVL